MKIISSSMDRARQYLAAVPGAISGAGGHNQAFSAACALVNGFALSEADALSLLREWNASCQPAWNERELEHKVRSAANARHAKPRGHLLGSGIIPSPSQRPIKRVASRAPLDPVTAAENYLRKFDGEISEADLWEASPIRPPDDWRQHGIVLVSALYRAGERINFVIDHEMTELGKCRPRGGWLRMNPVDGFGVGDANVTAFRFGLLESDELPPELQLRPLARLPLPIAAIITSGARSLHAWVRVDAYTADEYRRRVGRILELLAPFSIDGQNKNPSRLSRLPGVQRKIGAVGDGRQRLLYLNPAPATRRILP
ncbi:MAG: hypothetical protein HY269_07570 [Deltaproteobacteria bacterium]|nr:hypothetical protein [Deltaproteobacteria bacterium]